MNAILTLTLALWLPGCGGTSSAPEAGPSAEELAKLPDANVARMTVQFLEELVAAGEAERPDCGAMADAMQPVLDRNRGLLEVGRRYRADPEKRKWFDENYGEQTKESGMWLSAAMRHCEGHEEMEAIGRVLMQ